MSEEKELDSSFEEKEELEDAEEEESEQLEESDSDEDEETVVIKKSEYEKQKRDLFNLKRATNALRHAKKEQRGVAAKEDSEFVSKKDFFKSNERLAIKRATTVSPDDSKSLALIKREIDENWDEIKTYYVGKSGKNTVDDIYEDILDGHATWRRRNPKKESDKSNEKVAELSRERGVGARTPEQRRKKQGFQLLKSSTSPKDWYPEE